jgi:hypothetical protein
MQLRTKLLIALIVACAILSSSSIARAAPILNVFAYSNPTEVNSGATITYTASIFSTSEIVEMVHIYAVSKPWVRFNIAGVAQDHTLGEVTCQPTLTAVDCDVPIKVGYPVYMFAQLDAPLLGTCDPSIYINVTASIAQDRLADAEAVTHLLDATTCTYLPIITVSDNPQ